MILRCMIALVLALAPAVAQEPTPAQVAAPTPTPAPPKLEEVLLAPGFYQQTVETLTPMLAALKFGWISSAQDGARSVSPQLSFGGQHIDEAVFRFAETKPTSATLLFYSRGLSEELNERLFDERLDRVQSTLTSLLSTQPKKKARDQGSVVRADGLEWETPESQVTLEWSASKNPFRGEFIRLTVAPKVSQQRAIGETTTANANRAAVKKFVGADHVVKADGDVKIVDVPMVDQGERGYCVVASAERLMRYYGATVDQTELAQIANSDADKGTSTQAMADSLKKLTARLGVKLKPLYDWNVADFLKMIEDYNKLAKKEKAQEIRLGSYMIDVQEIFQKMDPALYRQVRLKKASDESKFQRDIVRNIDEGIPLLWSVNIGMVPEGNVKQYSGGHMRLIIGYNTAKKEIIYSDSWGPGHEQKRMSLEDAWVITSGLSSLQPIGT